MELSEGLVLFYSGGDNGAGKLDEGNGLETSLEKAAFLRFERHELMRQS